MSTANPLSFVGGMILEIGAAIAVVAVLWQPQQGDARPALQPNDHVASRPVQFSASEWNDRGSLQPEFVQRATPIELPYQPVNQRTYSHHSWSENDRLLPPAPVSYAEMPRETRIATAQPVVRRFDERAPAFAPQPPQPRYAPVHRTADSQRDHFYSRY